MQCEGSLLHWDCMRRRESTITRAAPRPGLALPGCWKQWSVLALCGCWCSADGGSKEGSGHSKVAGKSLKIPLFLPLGKVAGPLQKTCSSCVQEVIGTESREGPQISILHIFNSCLLIPTTVLLGYGLSLHTVLSNCNTSSPCSLQMLFHSLGLRHCILLQLTMVQ